MLIEKINAKIDFSAKKFKKVCILQRKHEQFQTQFSRKLQRFRGCRKNKKCSIFHELSEYQQKVTTFFPLDCFFKACRLMANSKPGESCTELGSHCIGNSYCFNGKCICRNGFKIIDGQCRKS